MTDPLTDFASYFTKFDVTPVHLAITLVGGFIVIVRAHLYAQDYISPMPPPSPAVWYVLAFFARKGEWQLLFLFSQSLICPLALYWRGMLGFSIRRRHGPLRRKHIQSPQLGAFRI